MGIIEKIKRDPAFKKKAYLGIIFLMLLGTALMLYSNHRFKSLQSAEADIYAPPTEFDFDAAPSQPLLPPAVTDAAGGSGLLIVLLIAGVLILAPLSLAGYYYLAKKPLPPALARLLPASVSALFGPGEAGPTGDSLEVPVPGEISASAGVLPAAKGMLKREPAAIRTNLIQGEIISFFDWREGLTMIFLFVSFGLFLIGACYGGLIYYEQSQRAKAASMTDAITELQENILRLKKDVSDVSDLKKRINSTRLLLDRHIYWTQFFAFLEANTLKEVQYGGFSGDTKGFYALQATTDNFFVLAEQIKLWRQNEMVVSASALSGAITGAGEEGTSVVFPLELEIDPAVFLKPPAGN